MSIIEMRMLRLITENLRKDRMCNEEICLNIGVTHIDER